MTASVGLAAPSTARFEPSARVIADSISDDGVRLTTVEATMHRFVLAELNTHRIISKNSASSRARPIGKVIDALRQAPADPLSWPTEKSGMQGGEELDTASTALARRRWESHREAAITEALELRELGVHKSVTNRLLEPFSTHTVVMTATAWENFFAQRCSPLAQPEIRAAAEAIRAAMAGSEPRPVEADEWHLPYVAEEDVAVLKQRRVRGNNDPIADYADEHGLPFVELLARVSAARCARTSYLTQDGRRDPMADLDLYERLVTARPAHCYDSQTEVLTPGGFMPFTAVTDEPLGCWDAKLSSLVYERPFDLISEHYEGPMYRVSHPKVDLLVTPGHRMWISRRANHGSRGMAWNEPAVCPAKDLGDSSMVRYYKAAPFTTMDDVAFDDLPPSDDHDALMQLVGFFLGDGSAAPLSQCNPNRLSFNVRLPRKVGYLQAVTAATGWELTEQKHGFAVSAPGVGAAFRKTFYDDAGHKVLPGIFNQRQSLLLLDGLRNSDGSSKRKTWVYDTTSPPLKDAVERLLLHAGLSWTTSSRPRVDPAKHAPCWRIGVHTSSEAVINQGRRNTSYEHYSGQVVCATVRTGLLVVRRNGQVVISGNSSPLEHVATPWPENRQQGGAVPLQFGDTEVPTAHLPRVGNLLGWRSLRTTVETETWQVTYR